MAADWLGINSSHYDSHCGDDGTNTVEGALDGSGYWYHGTEHTHWFVVDLGQIYDVQKIRGRSEVLDYDPIDVNIYVSVDGIDWGAAVASGVSTWQDTGVWQEVDCTDKQGQFVKVEIIETERVLNELGFGGYPDPVTIFDVYGEVPTTTVEPVTFELALTQEIPTTLFPLQTILPDTFELAASLEIPEILAGVIVHPDTFELALTQHAPGVRIDYTFLAETLELALTLQAPSVFPIITVSADSLALAVALLSPIVVIDVTVTPDTFALALTQHAPTISTAMIIYPAVLELEVALHAPGTISRYTDIPPFMQKDLIDPYSGGAWLWLCEIAVPGQAKVRIARNTENVRYDYDDFEKFNFQIGEQVFSGDGSIPRVTLQIFQDVNRVIEDMVNETEGALGAGVKLIRVNEKFLDTPVAALEADYENLASESNTEWVTFTLGVPNPLTQRFPLRNDRYDVCPWATPSLFKGPECQYTGSDGTCTGTFNDCYLKGNAELWGAELGLDPNVVRV